MNQKVTKEELKRQINIKKDTQTTQTFIIFSKQLVHTNEVTHFSCCMYLRLNSEAYLHEAMGQPSGGEGERQLTRHANRTDRQPCTHLTVTASQV